MRISGIARRRRDVPHPPDVSDTLLERTVVSTKSGPLGKIEKLEPFDVEVEDGTFVRVELAQHVRLEPVDISDPKWGDIEKDPSFAALRGSAPGPHVVVHVRRARVEHGAKVELLAQDDPDYAFSVATGHRSAPERKLVTVTARAIAAGPTAAAVIDRLIENPASRAERQKKKVEPTPTPANGSSKFEPKTSTTWLVFLLVAVIFAGAAAALRVTPLAVDLALLGVVCISAAFAGRALSRVPRFVSDGKVLGSQGDQDEGRIVYFATMGPIIFIGMCVMADHSGPWLPPNTPPDQIYNASWVSAVVLALWAMFLAWLAVVRGRNEARLCRVLLDAPPLPKTGALTRTWGSFEGVVRDPTPVTAEGEAVAIVHVINEEVRPGSDPNIYTERFLSKGTFFVDDTDGSGRSIEIHPDGAVWASTVGLTVPRSPKGNGPLVVDYLRVVPLRGSILVAGRVERDDRSSLGRVASGGHESLLFVAAREGDSARHACRAMLVYRRLGLVVALATLAVAVATIAFVEPHLPKFNIPSSGD